MRRFASRLLRRGLGSAGALAVIGVALWRLHAAQAGVETRSSTIERAPTTVFRPVTNALGPVVVIAHGFAGSQQLMQSFALTFARNGYTAVTFDFSGHGRNPAPLGGSITEESGATRTLVAETERIVRFARGLGDGRVVLLGHSMASDIVVRVAQQTQDVAATIAVSMFSPAVAAASPHNLLVIVGEWETMLKREALRAVALAAPGAEARPGVTYGDPAAGTGRRAAFSAHVEHASVLFSQDSTREALAWLDATFGVVRPAPPVLDDRGPWILLLIAGVIALSGPLLSTLPRAANPPVGAGLGWRRIWAPLLLPAVATPLMLRVLPTHFLPILVGDYLAAHFAVYGLLTTLCIAWTQRGVPKRAETVSFGRIALAASAMTAYSLIALVWPIDAFVTSFTPGRERFVLILVMLAGTLAYFLADEWLTRGPGAARGAPLVSRLAFLGSLALAVALDFQRLFFLLIIVPVILLFFVVTGLFNRWAYRATGHPFVAGVATALLFAWAIGVTFPMLAG